MHSESLLLAVIFLSLILHIPRPIALVLIVLALVVPRLEEKGRKG